MKLTFDQERDFFTRVDNILQTRKQIGVMNVSGKGIAYTDMKNIYIDFGEVVELFGTDYDSFLKSTRGLNYHELAHILYTKGSSRGSAFQTEFNILEDQRIENLFSIKYPKAEDYFKLNVLELLSKDLNAQSYILVYGRRRFLRNPKLLAQMKSLAVESYGKSTVEEVEQIIDQYLVTTDYTNQRNLARRLCDLVGNLQHQTSGLLQGGASTKSVSKDEKNSTDQLSKEIAESLTGEEQKVQSGTIEEIQQSVDEEKDSTSESLQDDIEAQKENMGKYGHSSDLEGDTQDNRDQYVPSNHNRIEASKLKRIINFLKNELGNKTVYSQKSGRLDLRRAMSNHQSTKITDFKRFKPSRLNKTRMAVSILVDSSGSMGNYSSKLARDSAWTISKALEECGSVSEIIEFSRNPIYMKRFDKKIEHAVLGRKQWGGTMLCNSLEQAHEDLKQIRKQKGIEHQLVIIITDGYIDDQRECEKQLSKMKEEGISTVHLGVCNKGYNPALIEKHYVSEAKHVPSFDKLNETMRSIVYNIQREIIRKVKWRY